MGGGISTTHVANAYEEDIYVMVAGDRKYVTLAEFTGSMSVGVEGIMKVSNSQGVKTKYDWEYAMKNGYTAIASGSFLGFNPDTNRPTVYITILSKSGRVICHCYPIQDDFSVIVDKRGYVRETKYGKIWVDKSGNQH